MARQMHRINRPFPNFLSIWGLTPEVKLDSLHRGEQFDASLRRTAMATHRSTTLQNRA